MIAGCLPWSGGQRGDTTGITSPNADSALTVTLDTAIEDVLPRMSLGAIAVMIMREAGKPVAAASLELGHVLTITGGINKASNSGPKRGARCYRRLLC